MLVTRGGRRPRKRRRSRSPLLKAEDLLKSGLLRISDGGGSRRMNCDCVANWFNGECGGRNKSIVVSAMLMQLISFATTAVIITDI